MAKSKLITVLATNSRVSVVMAKSLLEDAAVEYFIKGEDLQSLLNYGIAIGPIEIQVAEEDAEEAKEILKDLT